MVHIFQLVSGEHGEVVSLSSCASFLLVVTFLALVAISELCYEVLIFCMPLIAKTRRKEVKANESSRAIIETIACLKFSFSDI